MKIKVKDATGVVLNYLVAKAEGYDMSKAVCFNDRTGVYGLEKDKMLRYSTDWAQGGPIIERERINSIYTDDQWEADLSDQCFGFGGSMLKAAMRCHVINNLGEEVEVPDELLEIA